MDQLFALHAAWPARDPSIALGALVLLALLGGEAAARWLRLPRITGYAATGMLLGALGVLPRPLTPALRNTVDFCLGLVLFEVGARIDLGWYRRAPWLAGLALAESALVGGALYALLHVGFALDPLLAACGAALGAATSPAVALRVASDLSAQGQVTERMLLFAATNSALAVLVLAGILPVFPGETMDVAVRRSLFVLAGSLLLAAALAGLALAVFRALGKRRDTQLVAALALVLLATRLSASLGLSVALVTLAFGFGLRSLDRGEAMLALDFGRTGQLFYLLLFALTAASLDLSLAVSAAAAAGMFIAVRALAKTAAVLAFSGPTRQPWRRSLLLALALQPMSGLAALLLYDASAASAPLAALVAPFVLGPVALLELVGPLCVQLAVRLAGEARPETS